ncbi:single-stranded DNA-binding protein [Jiangella asiatica]|nr:single-stranded DNA-binding protein [Jiangella asiatica]
MNTTSVPIVEHSNEVRLVGRVAAEPTVVLLPSGDQLVTARLVVQRPRPPAGLGSRRGVDTITCTAWSPHQRRRLRVWNAGDTVEVTGALRRRFWRGSAGPQSRFEIEVESAKRLARCPPEERGARLRLESVP